MAPTVPLAPAGVVAALDGAAAPTPTSFPCAGICFGGAAGGGLVTAKSLPGARFAGCSESSAGLRLVGGGPIPSISGPTAFGSTRLVGIGITPAGLPSLAFNAGGPFATSTTCGGGNGGNFALTARGTSGPTLGGAGGDVSSRLGAGAFSFGRSFTPSMQCTTREAAGTTALSLARASPRLRSSRL